MNRHNVTSNQSLEAWRTPEVCNAFDSEWAEVIQRACYIFNVRSEREVPAHLREEFDSTVERLYRTTSSQAFARDMVAIDQAYVDMTDRLDRERRHAETIAAIKQSHPTAVASNFVQRHPFLAGFLGMSIYQKIRDR